MELVSTKIAAERYGLKEPTVRSWIRQELVAGRSGRPSLVEVNSLMEYLISTGANQKLLNLYSSKYASVATPVDGEEC